MGFSRQEYWSELPFILQEIVPIQGSNPHLLHCRQILYHLSHKEAPVIDEENLKEWSVIPVCGPEQQELKRRLHIREPRALRSVCQVTFWKARPVVHPDGLCGRIQFGTRNL